MGHLNPSYTILKDSCENVLLEKDLSYISFEDKYICSIINLKNALVDLNW